MCTDRVRKHVGPPCTHYFGDFTLVMPEGIGEASDHPAGNFLKETGWDVTREKDKPVAPVVTALGVDFGLTEPPTKAT